jgi:hypothetical protein
LRNDESGEVPTVVPSPSGNAPGVELPPDPARVVAQRKGLGTPDPFDFPFVTAHEHASD